MIRAALYQTAGMLYRRVKGLPATIAGKRNGRYDREIIEVIRRTLQPGTVGIDVGAHRGTVLRKMLALAPAAKHVAAEPLPHLAGRLRQEFPGVRVVEAALSDYTGKAIFHHVVNDPALSGLLPLDDVFDGNAVIEEMKVDVLRLDEVIARDEAVSFIKINTAGAELSVIRGAEDTIWRWNPVVVFGTGLRTPSVRPHEIIKTFRGLGMDLSTMERWLRGDRPLTRRQFHRAMDTEFFFIAYY